MSIMFNQICINEEILPKYTYTNMYIHINAHKYVHAYTYTHLNSKILYIGWLVFIANQPM